MEKRNCAAGPYIYHGSDSFVVIYQSQEPNQRFKWYQTIYALPDSTTCQLIGDYQNKVDMSTFLGNGQILCKLGYRFMIYNTDGIFRDEIAFDNENDDLAQQTMAENAIGDSLKQKVLDNTKEEDQGAKGVLILNKAHMKKKNQGEKIEQHNRMMLHKSSIDYKFFLFEDRIKKKLGVYCLDQENDEYQFKFQFDLDLRQKGVEALFNILDISIETGIEDEDIDAFYKVLNSEEKKINVQLEENGAVTFTINKHEEKDVKIKVYACVFSNSKFKDFEVDCDFDKDAKNDVLARLDLQESTLQYQLKTEMAQQQHLATAFKNPRKMKELSQKLYRLKQKRKNTVFSQIYDDDLLIVQCGRYIQYGYFDTDIWENDKKINFTEADINFSKEILIEKIWGTQKNFNIQIVAIDDIKQILFILTWDFSPNKNVEVSMLQFNIEPDTQPQNYLVKGMNEKMNYFLNKHQIFDLEYNIPLQTTNFNTLNGDGIKNHTNQRKIYKDPSKSLSIDHGHILNFPICRIDLIFWMNIQGLGAALDPQQIVQNTPLESLNVIYDGNSLLHHFAGVTEVITAIHDKYMQAREDGTLTNQQINMPLVMLNPDSDGKTALDLAIDQLAPKSFEMMIDMLEEFPDFCLSKMMLQAIPNMIQSGSTMVNKFFDSASYKPPLLQQSMNCVWPEDQEEFIFPSNTSLITEEACQKQIYSDKTMMVKIMIQKGQSKLEQLQDVEEVHGKEEILRDQQLKVKNQHDSQSVRLQVETLDFDWIFKKNNAKTMLKLLGEEDSELFLSKSIKVFVEFMWTYYQPVIMKRIFVPFLFYLICFIYLISSVAGDYLKRIKVNETEHPDTPYHEVVKVWLCCILCFICFNFLAYFSYKEVLECYSSPVRYVKEFWNWFDLLQFFLNFSFMTFLMINVTSGYNIIDIHNIRTIGALAGWVMWIKVFYWMRLFKSTSYFIILIVRTITDSASFIIMLLIVFFAYANLNFILQLNVSGAKYKGDDVYVTTYVEDWNIFNSVMAQYMVALGQFEAGNIGHGPSCLVAWFAFLSSSYILTIGFMNLLIAIMGNTFGEVLEMREQAALLTVISLMCDYIDDVDHEKAFKNMRYIIRVSPDVQKDEDTTDIVSYAQNISSVITGKQDGHQKAIMKRLSNFEKGMRTMMKGQTNSVGEVKTLLAEILEKATPATSAQKKESE